MSIFIGQLVGFAVIAFVLVRYVGPPMNKAVAKQQAAIQTQIDESDLAKKQLAQAQTAYADAMSKAETEASRIREEARADSQSIAQDIKAKADAEVARISEHGKAQVGLNRAALVRQLRGELGLSSVDLAGKLVRDHLADPSAKSESVDRVIGELESMSGSTPDAAQLSHADLVGTHTLRASSRDSVRALQKVFNDATASADAEKLTTVSDELLAVVGLLDKHPLLRKSVAESGDVGSAKEELVGSLLTGKVSDTTLQITKHAATQRWSSARDLSYALERLSRQALLKCSEQQGTLDATEDELFRVGRLLVAQPQLTQTLSNSQAPVQGRVDLLKSLLSGKVGEVTLKLVEGAIRSLRGRSADVVVSELADLAAARRGESVAHVIAASPLSGEQVTRLGSVLAQIYGRPVSPQVEINPEVLGGLRISVGDEVIAADIATRLAKAAEQLPR